MERFIRDTLRDLKPYTVDNREGYCLLDANENPDGLAETIVEGIIEEIKKVNRYPDNGDRVKEKLAAFLGSGVTQENIILTNGGDGGINLIANTFLNPGDTFLTVEPTFSMYKFYSTLVGGKHEIINYLPEYKFPLDSVKEKLGGQKPPKLFFICSPNNPTGGAISLEEIEGIVKSGPNTIYVIDNAYIEFGGESALPLIAEYPNIVILRTFSKALGLAGLRIGYCVAQRETAELLKRALPPFLVSRLSLAIAERILDYSGLIEDRVNKIKTQRDFLYGQLSRIDSLKIYPSQANFFFIQSKDPDLGQFLKKKGILIRDFGYGNIRISVGSESENYRLLEALINGK